ncbi:unnamed protein product [Rotaria socialis]|uniref:Uncharacterized protein n=1 Tax=Rotaria socialis TaxID=392032 RepID=A0A818MZ23_9BILA|nr:unnamed protein product [Rotaria socialis]CAF3340523.1 unnamed protein product [Rotaria socialis]CAF3596625.1 unnamed protein product [Rotaria socialis]CAF3648677.1 unnamed protein product [Rotaria socialis]
MLSSFATASTSSSSSPYETSSSRWKFNFTTNSFAALSAIFFASYVPSPQESSIINVAEKRKTSSVYNYRCEYLKTKHSGLDSTFALTKMN